MGGASHASPRAKGLRAERSRTGSLGGNAPKRHLVGWPSTRDKVHIDASQTHREAARVAKQVVQSILARVGLKVVRTGPRPFEEFRDFIPCAPTIAAARASGQSVGGYIDVTYGEPGTTERTIGAMVECGAINPRIRHVLEIGPGSGRYLERVVAICRPDSYEIYETAVDWRGYLGGAHDVVVQPTDGQSLAATPNACVDLVHAHKVFPGLPLLVAARYLREMARVTAPGGFVVFDAVTEATMSSEVLDAWLTKVAAYDTYPSMLATDWLREQFHGFELVARKVLPMPPGSTDLHVFRKAGAAAS